MGDEDAKDLLSVLVSIFAILPYRLILFYKTHPVNTQNGKFLPLIGGIRKKIMHLVDTSVLYSTMHAYTSIMLSERKKKAQLLLIMVYLQFMSIVN